MKTLVTILMYKRRYLRELEQLSKNNHTEIYEFVEQTGRSVILSINGPNNTIYENKKYIVHITLSSNYPFSPPTIIFITPIIHPNIYQGTICVDTFHNNWTPAYTMHSIATIIQSILMCPDISNEAMTTSVEHTKYKKSSMLHFKTWGGRRNFMLYLARMNIWRGEKNPIPVENFPQSTNQNAATLDVFTNRCYLQNILSYL